MHLITCYKSRALAGFPNVLPPALFEAAARRPNPAARSPVAPAGPSAIPRQFTGPQARAQSPLARAAFGAPPAMAPQTTGPAWLITPQEKSKYDQFFSGIDTSNNGYLSGEQAVKFFSDSGLPEDTLASVWDLADINSEGQLNRDEFAVAMYLIRQQRSGAPLPAFLPPALIPPSMRNQSHPAPQTTAPAFDNANNSSQLPKSATEDLFGLDEPMPQMSSQQPTLAPVSAQNTGSVFGADPFAGGSKPSSPPPTSPTRNFTPQQTGGGPASLFKPFIPTSAFGATLASQHTGSSNAPSNAPGNTARSVQPPSAMDDLLGASNEEETKNITEDTTELANMSNQLGNLRNQMQDVQTKKTTNERDLAASSAQKRELEQRLAQFRAQYEQEVRTVKSLEEQLANSRNETKKLQQEFAMIEGTYQDLQNQNQQISQALSADQQENASLKQRISQMNTEIAQLKPQLDKMRSDARQQKGMVAINKKQLATNEGEHEKIQSEMGDLKKAAEEHEQQMREQAAQEERSRQVAQEERSRSVVSPPSTVVSPAPSNTNPFFRKATATREEGTLSPPSGAFSSGAPNHSAFDALFGPSASQQQAGPHTPPVTSFRSEPSGNSASSDGRMTPASPTLSAATHDEAPPPPPESRQFTPNILPMRQPLTRDQSVASSNRAAPPGSRLGEQDAASVSSPWDAAPASSYSSNPWGGEDVATPPAQMSGPAIQSQNHDSSHDAASRDLSPEKLEEDIPGAFPETPMETQSTGQSTQAPVHDFDSAFAGFGEGHQSSNHAAAHDPFAPAPVSREVEHEPPSYGNQAAAHDPFASAPVSREVERTAPTYGNQNAPHDSFSSAPVSRAVEPALPNYGNSEFPPIQTLEHEDTSSDDDSDSERGFGDDFGSSEHHATAAATEVPSSEHHEITPVDTRRPSAVGAQSAADVSELPPITAQTSPPSYEAAQEGQHRSGSNSFPPEFAGLLPAREDPTQSPVPHSIPHEQQPQTPLTSTAGSDHFHDAHSRPMSSITDAGTTPFTNLGDVTQHVTPVAPQETTKDAFDDDFDDFDDLAEAKEASGENFDFGFPHHQNTDEFDSNFDSPAQSTLHTASSAQETPVTRSAPSGFSNFESNTGVAHQPIPIAIPFGSTHEPQAQQPHDWDAIFSGLDTPAPVVEPTPNFSSNSRSTDAAATPSLGSDSRTNDGAATPKASSSGKLSGMPVLGRAISMGTEHDDPILKRLTGMGYQREKALDALEKYDYDIDRVSVS
jgi:epidermal growth factor receptor substrate 15